MSKQTRDAAKRERNIALFTQIGGLVAALVASGGAYWLTKATDAAAKTDIAVAILSAFLTYLVALQLGDLLLNSQITSRLTAIDNRSVNIEKLSSLGQRLGEQVRRLLVTNQNMRALGLQVMNQALSGFHYDEKTSFFRIKGAELSFFSYKSFWDQMIDIQLRHPEQLVARITHASDVGPWRHKASQALRDATDIHSHFIGRGGKVYRIFLDCGSTGRPKDYVEAMRQMRDAGIHVAYMRTKRATNIEDDDLIWDFCSIGPVNYSSDWYFDAYRRVEHCEIGNRESAYARNMKAWEKFLRALIRYNDDFSNFGSADRDFIMKCNHEFKVAYGVAP